VCVCCSVLQCVLSSSALLILSDPAVCCSVLQCVCVAVCCSVCVLQCVFLSAALAILSNYTRAHVVCHTARFMRET